MSKLNKTNNNKQKRVANNRKSNNKKSNNFCGEGKTTVFLAIIIIFITSLPLVILLEDKFSSGNSSAATDSVSATSTYLTDISTTASTTSISNNSEVISQDASSDLLLVSRSFPGFNDNINTDFPTIGSVTVGALSDESIGFESDYWNNDDFLYDNDLDGSLTDNDILIDVGSEYQDLAIANVFDFVNVRSNPSTDAQIVGKIYNGAVAHVLGTAGPGLDWLFIESGSVTGYIKSEYFIFGDEAAQVAEEYVDKYATVLCETLNVREEPTSSSSRIGFVNSGEKLSVTGIEDGWIKVSYTDNKEGYVSSDFVSITEEFTYARTLEEDEAILLAEAERNERVKEEAAAATAENLTYVNISTPPSQLYTSNEELRQGIVDYAMQFLGNRYVSGGNSLSGGTDCSGFTSLIYADFGYSLSRIPQGQYTSNGRSISYEEAQPGDIVCYSGNGTSCTHVGIYIGNGMIIHSSTPARGVVTDSITACGSILAIKNVID